MNYSKKSMLYLGLLCSVLMLGCEKDFAPTASQSNQSSQNAKVLELNETQFDQVLDDFWSNYASYLGVPLDIGITPNLNKKLSKQDAVELLHYASNIAYVRLDTTYENEVTDSTVISFNGLSDTDSLTMYNTCEAMQNLTNWIKQKIVPFASAPYSISRLSLVSNESSSNIRIQIRITNGSIWSTSVLSLQSAINKSFTSPIPWLTKQSIPDDFNPIKTPNTTNTYLTWLFYGQNGSSVSQATKVAAFNNLPSTRAAHQHLSNGSVFWPDPVAQLNGWYPAVTNRIAVATPADNFGNIPGTSKSVVVKRENGQNIFGSQTVSVVPPEVIDCANPNHPGSIMNPGLIHVAPSKLLGWYVSEYSGGAIAIRNVNPTLMGFYWQNRVGLVLTSLNKRAQNEINIRMSLLNGKGFYAVTRFDILPSLNQNLGGQCSINAVFCVFGNVCLHGTEYYFEPAYSHFTWQKRIPPYYYAVLNL